MHVHTGQRQVVSYCNGHFSDGLLMVFELMAKQLQLWWVPTKAENDRKKMVCRQAENGVEYIKCKGFGAAFKAQVEMIGNYDEAVFMQYTTRKFP